MIATTDSITSSCTCWFCFSPPDAFMTRRLKYQNQLYSFGDRSKHMKHFASQFVLGNKYWVSLRKNKWGIFFLWIMVELTHLKYKSRQLKHKRGNLVNLTFSELKVLFLVPDYADTRVQFGWNYWITCIHSFCNARARNLAGIVSILHSVEQDT